MKVSVLLGAALLAASFQAFAAPPPREVCITIDDLPWVEFDLSTPAEVATRHRALMRATRGTRAIGFVNEQKMEVDGKIVPARREMLEDWLRNGLELGNHTYDHVGLTATPIADYEAAITRGEQVLRPMLARYHTQPRWFRHPFLQAGRDEATRDELARFLTAHGYQIAPVTVDNGDWVFARAYINLLAQHRDAEAKALIGTYVAYMEAKFQFFEQNAKRLFGREIRQILLIHASALNSQALPLLLDRLRRRGYVFIDIERAMQDPAYEHADGYRGGAGISWLHRWAMAEKQPNTFYENEPAVPKQVLDWAGVEGE